MLLFNYYGYAVVLRPPDILSSIIMNNDSENNKLPALKIHKLPFNKNRPVNNISINEQGKKVYMLISKNIKLKQKE